MSAVEKYVKKLEAEKRKIEGELLLKNRSLSRILEKLSDPAFHLAKEQKRGAVKVSKLLGQEVAPKTKTVLKKKSDVVEKVELPTVEMDLPAPPAPAAPEKKKGALGGFFG